MVDLYRKPDGSSGKVHALTPQNAGWTYVDRLKSGESAAESRDDREVILVLVEGKATMTSTGKQWGEMGDIPKSDRLKNVQ